MLDFTWVIVGPFGTRILADYGATVVRIESVARIDPVRGYQPFKDGIAGVERSAQHANANVNKLGFSLNMSTPEGRELAWKLVRWADVVVENFAPGAMRNWGMDYEALRAVNPGIIMVSTCLSGQDGPQASLAGFGTMGAALSGFHEVTGWPDRAPAGPFLAYTDYIAPRYMVAGILAALDHRRRTGNGTCIDISQQEAAVPLIGPALLEYTVNGRVMSRQGNRSPEHAPHGVYPAAGDDQWAAIACETGRQWEALCQAAGHPGWAGDPRFATFEARKANEDALDATIGAWTASLTAGELEDLLQAAGVPVHRVSGSDDAFADPQLIHRKHFVTTNNPEIGPIPVEASRFRLSRTPAEVHWPGPPLGQHNERVLRDILGMSEDELVEVIATGCLE